MRPFYSIFVFVFLLFVSCSNKNTRKNDIELSTPTKQLIDLFLRNPEIESGIPIYIEGGYVDNFYALSVFEGSDAVEKYQSGNYYGSVVYNGRTIKIWGDSWNGYFWKSYNKPRHIQGKEKILEELVEDDYFIWTIYIDQKDTVVLQDYQCQTGYSSDTLTRIVRNI